MRDSYMPYEAEVVERLDEAPDVFTLRLRFTDPAEHRAYSFRPGQFNMVYLYGVGEVAISIVSDPRDDMLYDHTIRAVGRVTKGLQCLNSGDRVGIRGPYGQGWPLRRAIGKNMIIVTGGLGCAPVISVINYIMRRRDRYGAVKIMQGVKHSKDLIYRQYYERWEGEPNTEVMISADTSDEAWPWYQGRVVPLLSKLTLDPANTVCFMCGPEMMMKATVNELFKHDIPADAIYLSMERNMECGFGQCGHCQYGGKFVCRDGPIFAYAELRKIFGTEGI